MAEENETPESEEEVAAGGGKKKLILFGIIGLLLAVIIGGAVWFFLLRETPAEDAPADGEVAAQESAASDDETDTDGASVSTPDGGPAQYVRMTPPILTSFFQGERIRNLQLRATLVTRSDETAAAIRAHMPKLAAEFATRLRDLSLKQVMDPQVRLELREQMTEMANQVLVSTGSDAGVEATLFEQVVVQ